MQRHVVIVAHKTLVGEHLVEEVTRRLGEVDADYRFHLIVPVTHPSGLWNEAEVEAAAHRRLADGLETFSILGARVTGEIGDANPVTAVTDYLNRGAEPDEVIVSTLPGHLSKWLGLDVPNRMARALRTVPVSHVVGDAELAEV